MTLANDTGVAVRPLLVGAEVAAQMLGIGRSHFLAMHSACKIGPLPVSLGKRKLWVVQEIQDWTLARCPSREKWQEMRGAEAV